MSVSLIILLALGYLLLLFVIAYIGDRRAASGRSLIHNPFMYALSLAVFCTAWTYYGSIGRAATSGPGFLTVYLGPVMLAPLWVLLMRKTILIAKQQRVTSVADFLSSRYGKSYWMGLLVALVAIIGILPYVSIQLKAISMSFDLLINSPDYLDRQNEAIPITHDSAFYVAAILALFTILFGTRHVDPNERHEGLVLSIAIESLVKLLIFILAGCWLVYSVWDGPVELFTRAIQDPDLQDLLVLPDRPLTYWSWGSMLLLSALASILLPRQFHIGVVESTDVRFLNKAAWMFPLYLLLINLLVLPLAIAGRSFFQGIRADADTFILLLPKLLGNEWLSMLVFLGGLSAATGMVIVSVIALSIMMSNHILMPLFFQTRRWETDLPEDLHRHLLGFRRLSIVVILFLAYGYFRFVGHSYGLVSIGLISFAAIAQFAPAMIGGLYWKKGNERGALTGLVLGVIIWAYTLPFPMLMENGSLPDSVLVNGLGHLAWLKPYELFGLTGLDPVVHSFFWSMMVNTAAYVLVSMYTRSKPVELVQADFFVHIFKYIEHDPIQVSRRSAPMAEIRRLFSRFFGPAKADQLLDEFGETRQLDVRKTVLAGPEVVDFAERQIAGAIGSSSATVLMNSISREEPVSISEVLRLLDSTQETVQHAREMEEINAILRQRTAALEDANRQLRELDQLKAEFIATVTHELRTPLTSIKSFAHLLKTKEDLDGQRKARFLNIIAEESDRISRLVGQVLDLERLESAHSVSPHGVVDLGQVTAHALAVLEPLLREHQIRVEVIQPEAALWVNGSRDDLHQVWINILSNAIKFCPADGGLIQVTLKGDEQDHVHIWMDDNGPGVAPEYRERIFEKFVQVHSSSGSKPPGSGLGLAITRAIILQHQGNIEARESPLGGVRFVLTFPRADHPE